MKFHLHSYSKWSEPVNTYDTGHKQQWRSCTVCNKANFRILRWDKQTELTSIIAALRSVATQEKLI